MLMADPAERGRYAIYDTGDGLIIARASGLCDRCTACDCGHQEDNLDLTSAGLAKLMKGRLPGPLLKMLGPLAAGMGKVR